MSAKAAVILLLRKDREEQSARHAIAEPAIEDSERCIAARHDVGHDSATGQDAGQVGNCGARIRNLFEDGTRENEVVVAGGLLTAATSPTTIAS